MKRENTLEPRTCLFCGKVFKPRHGLMVYCSVDCVSRAREDKTGKGKDGLYNRVSYARPRVGRKRISKSLEELQEEDRTSQFLLEVSKWVRS